MVCYFKLNELFLKNEQFSLELIGFKQILRFFQKSYYITIHTITFIVFNVKKISLGKPPNMLQSGGINGLISAL